MQTTITGAAQPRGNAQAPCFTKRIGYAVYNDIYGRVTRHIRD